MSFSRIAVWPNAIFPNRRLAEHHFPEIALNRTNTTIKSKSRYREFRTLRILTVSMFKNV